MPRRGRRPIIESTTLHIVRTPPASRHPRANVSHRRQPLVEGSEAEFIAEHYWGYTARRRGGCSEYQVEHEPWRVWRVAHAELDCDVAAVYWPEFSEALQPPCQSAFVADGSPITVKKGSGAFLVD